MTHWTFKVFVDERGYDLFDEWKDLPPAAEAQIDVRINLLKVSKTWARPYAGKIRNCRHIWEIRVRHNRVQYRPLGYYGPGIGVFTLLIGAIEKDRKFIPKAAPEIAENRRIKISTDEKRYTRDYRPKTGINKKVIK